MIKKNSCTYITLTLLAFATTPRTTHSHSHATLAYPTQTTSTECRHQQPINPDLQVIKHVGYRIKQLGKNVAIMAAVVVGAAAFTEYVAFPFAKNVLHIRLTQPYKRHTVLKPTKRRSLSPSSAHSSSRQTNARTTLAAVSDAWRLEALATTRPDREYPTAASADTNARERLLDAHQLPAATGPSITTTTSSSSTGAGRYGQLIDGTPAERIEPLFVDRSLLPHFPFLRRGLTVQNAVRSAGMIIGGGLGLTLLT